jgi:hypothetical protein
VSGASDKELPMPTRILLQTTIPYTEDDWHIGRFGLLAAHLRGLTDAEGRPRFEVTARDRAPDAAGDDPVLSGLANGDFDELWLFAVDKGDGLSARDIAGIAAFWHRGGGVLTTRDHQDLGCSLIGLGPLGAAHFFHTQRPELDEARRVADDTGSPSISWPNYHSGANGDVQRLTATEPVHPLLRANGRTLERFPAHPHEGAVGVPDCHSDARVIATGKSQTTGHAFNLAVVFERCGEDTHGRAIAESSFHHFCDYNWNPEAGCPSFVEEAPSDAVTRNPALLDDIKAYVANVAAWLPAEKPATVMWAPEGIEAPQKGPANA